MRSRDGNSRKNVKSSGSSTSARNFSKMPSYGSEEMKDEGGEGGWHAAEIPGWTQTRDNSITLIVFD